MVAHAFNASRSLGLNPAWSTKPFLEQPWSHRSKAQPQKERSGVCPLTSDIAKGAWGD